MTPRIPRSWVVFARSAFVLTCVACAEYPRDAELRLNHVQVKGTHNSYHVSAAPDFLPWAYTHAPLATQLGAQGVRQVEIDIYWNAATGSHDVLHVPEYDALSTCATLAACLAPMRTWSMENPWHVPLFVLVELKDALDGTPGQFARLEAEVAAAWPREATLTPDDVRGVHETLPAALADTGWPTLGAVRGKAMFVLIGSEDIARAYFGEPASLAGKRFFGRGGAEVAWGGVRVLDGPFDQADEIRAALDARQLVRTRADGDSEEAYRGDTRRGDAAIATGAHMISTDYPVPDPRFDYVFRLEDDRAAVCNPVTAPPGCTDDDIERIPR